MDRGPVATPADDASQGKDALRRATAESIAQCQAARIVAEEHARRARVMLSAGRQLLRARQELLQTGHELLHGGLESMPVIQQAMGIVMAQHRCAPSEALDALLWDAQLADVKVSVLAAEMVRARAASTTGDTTMPPILD